MIYTLINYKVVSYKDMNIDFDLSKQNLKLLYSNHKNFINVSAVILSAFIVFCIIMTYSLSKQNTVSRLQKAILKKDTKTVISLIKSSDKRLRIDTKNANILIEYLNSDQKELIKLISTLNEQASALDIQEHINKYPCFNYYMVIRKSTDRFLFWNKYYFEIKPCSLVLSTAYSNTKLYIDGKYITTSNRNGYSYYCGLFITGRHKIRAECQTVFGSSQKEDSYDFIDTIGESGKASDLFFTISLPSKFFFADSNIPSAKLLINGKDTHKLISDFAANSESANPEMGPMEYNSQDKISAECTLPWGTFRSNEITVSGIGDNAYFEINALNDTAFNKIKEAIAGFNKQTLTTLLKTRDTSLCRTFNKNMPEFEMYVKGEFENMIEKNIYFTGNYLYSTIDRKYISIYYDKEKNEYYAYLDAQDYYDQDYNCDSVYGGDGPIYTSKSGKYSHYTVVYDIKNDKWQVTTFQ